MELNVYPRCADAISDFVRADDRRCVIVTHYILFLLSSAPLTIQYEPVKVQGRGVRLEMPFRIAPRCYRKVQCEILPLLPA